MQAVLTNPIIVVKTRMEVVGFNEYSGVFDAFKQVWIKEGIRGYFQGLLISLIRDVPHSAIFYPVYNSCRRLYGTALYSSNFAADPK